jgi:membrane fusion protein, copper/silver efflux system
MKNKVLFLSIALIAGILIGWLLFRSPGSKGEKAVKTEEQPAAKVKVTIWTCSMHPQIRMKEPGNCPICGMELIPLEQKNDQVDSTGVKLSREALQLANVSTSTVTRQNAEKKIRLYGKVSADERLLTSQVAHFPGRIEKLLVNFNGEKVSFGQALAQIYSPELLTAQQELIETARTKVSQPEIYEAAREKLAHWKLSNEQIAQIENSGTVKSVFEVSSGTNGIVTAVRIRNGDYVSEGTVLYEIADLSRLWVLFDAYESDLGFLNKGDKVSFTLQALPGKTYTGTISFIDPFIDPVNRVARVRVELKNEGNLIKPEMFATGLVDANLSSYHNKIVIPRSAVLWTGKRSIVYVRQQGEEPVFHLREIELGPLLGSNYVVNSGLSEGEEIVTSGTFSIDAAAQLEGKPSMMNQPRDEHNND